MTIPSMLGSGVRAMESKVDMLKRLGFSKREIEIILLEFSSILEVDYRNVSWGIIRMIKFVKSLDSLSSLK